MEALNKWLDSHLQLKQASSNFIEACGNLRSAVSSLQPFAPSSNTLVFEDILAKVASHIDMIALVETQMHTSRAMLSRMLNKSTQRVPINRLPAEILGQIFSIALAWSYCPTSGRHDVMQVIPLVCTRWNEVSIGTGALWCHVDVCIPRTLEGLNAASDRMRLFISRSRGIPIHLHLFFSDKERLPLDDISALAAVLQPHVSSVVSLEISDSYTSRWSGVFFQVFSEAGASNNVKSLTMNQVRHLTDKSITLPRDIFRGLTHLTISGPHRRDVRLVFDELVETLSCCSKLSVLRLQNLVICEAPKDKYPDIPLPYLKIFQVIRIVGRGAGTLLSILHPGTLELDMRICLNSRSDYFCFVQSLLARSNVTSLTVYVAGSTPGGHLEAFLASTPQLRSLQFVDETGGEFCIFSELKEILAPENQQLAALVPHIRALCIISGFVYASDLDEWEDIIVARELHMIGFIDCLFRENTLDPELDDNGGEVPNEIYYKMCEDDGEGKLPAFRESLSKRVGQVIIKGLPAIMHEGYDGIPDIEQFRMV
ncbi:pyrolysin [Ceratobasidium sp. AG-Ba]|nr:pyrolysin [Ceratobasidium sp. AG-Ba]